MNDPRQDGRTPSQEIAIARMHALGLTPAQVAALAGIENVKHVTEFLTRRTTMNVHKFDKVAAVLGLGLEVKDR